MGKGISLSLKSAETDKRLLEDGRWITRSRRTRTAMCTSMSLKRWFDAYLLSRYWILDGIATVLYRFGGIPSENPENILPGIGGYNTGPTTWD